MSNQEPIQIFLEGRSDQKYITSIEGNYHSNKVKLFLDDPVKGKRQEDHRFTPYLFMKDLKDHKIQLYQNSSQRDEMIKKYKIKIEKLRTDGNLRLDSGFKYLVTSDISVNSLTQFFKGAGVDPWDRKDIFQLNSPQEQFLIQTGKRLFKGFENYKDIHKLYFDIETTGLSPYDSKIFLIGIKDNRGFQHVIEIDDTPESELEGIELFFRVIDQLKPSIVCGHNSENFDFHFIIERAKLLGSPLKYAKYPTSQGGPIRRKKSYLKMASDTEEYEQTIMYGYNVMDIAHAVRRAMAINSDIKSWGLKYITKFAEKNKKDRMYVEGSKIYEIYRDNKNYRIDRTTNDYTIIKDNEYVSPTEDTITGKEIINQYLLDDLWETEQVDEVYNQSSFLLASLIPTGFSRVSTMGTAVTWKLLMMAYSYEQRISIPNHDKKRNFVGGLTRVFKKGFGQRIFKLDYASLYPSIMIEHNTFPPCDIDHVMRRILIYFYDTRNKYKKLTKKYEKTDKESSTYYDVRQLPIKILNNGFFGSLSAPEVFPWADLDLGEEITCTGRLYIRLMIKYFENLGFTSIILDTDGVNMSAPKDVDKHHYIGLGINSLVEKNKHYYGVDAVVAEFNDIHMKGVMGLDVDDEWKASINMARKNYVNLTYKGKAKITGNTLKSKKLQTYLENFINKGVKLILNNKPKEFIEYYYQYVEKIFNRELPLSHMANKSKVKLTNREYIAREGKTNINGKPLPKMAHMELLKESGIEKSLGETIYYINTGKMISHSDVGNCSLVDIETNPNELGYYNAPRYLSIFNKRIKPLLCVFKSDVRDTILVKNPKDRQYYTSRQMELIMETEDTIEEVMFLSFEEITFWNKVGKDPNEIFDGFSIDDSLVKLDIHKNKEIINKLKEKFKSQGVEVKSFHDDYKEGDFVINHKFMNDKEIWNLSEVISGSLVEMEELKV
ncbi:hypothetical protein COB55_03625 [Candidatus Wolfebacteria bacterium]|nr:MAG: hypothetical protein COB55_03625 [Candidatus Wolfebacteria bacterium]